MILALGKSIKGVQIRLTNERWEHIITSHLEINSKDFSKVMKVVTSPNLILKREIVWSKK